MIVSTFVTLVLMADPQRPQRSSPRAYDTTIPRVRPPATSPIFNELGEQDYSPANIKRLRNLQLNRLKILQPLDALAKDPFNIIEGRVDHVMDGDTISVIGTQSNSRDVRHGDIIGDRMVNFNQISPELMARRDPRINEFFYHGPATQEPKLFKIRLTGIDAPESNQAFAKEATDALTDKVLDAKVTVTWVEEDKYKWVLGTVYLGDRHINEELVSEGFAWHYKKYSDREELAEAELLARRGKIGLWTDVAAVAPWEFRRLVDHKTKGVIVYVNVSGTEHQYHAAGCRHLDESKRAISLSDAKGYGGTACSTCNPPN